MFQSSLFPGLLFHLCSSDHVTRLPVRKRIVSSPESQYERRTSTNTPSTSKIRICGRMASGLRRCVNRFALSDEVAGTEPRQIPVKYKDKLAKRVSPLRVSGSTWSGSLAAEISILSPCARSFTGERTRRACQEIRREVTCFIFLAAQFRPHF